MRIIPAITGKHNNSKRHVLVDEPDLVGRHVILVVEFEQPALPLVIDKRHAITDLNCVGFMQYTPGMMAI